MHVFLLFAGDSGTFQVVDVLSRRLNVKVTTFDTHRYV